jgi:hypothetical protein
VFENTSTVKKLLIFPEKIPYLISPEAYLEITMLQVEYFKGLICNQCPFPREKEGFLLVSQRLWGKGSSASQHLKAP